MPVGKGSVARAAKAAGTETKKSVRKAVIGAPAEGVLEAEKAAMEAQTAEKKADEKKAAEKKPAEKKTGEKKKPGRKPAAKPEAKSAVKSASGTKEKRPVQKAMESVGRVQRGELDGIMVIKSDLPIELL